MRRFLLSLILLAVSLTIAGCGGSTTTAPPTDPGNQPKPGEKPKGPNAV